MAQELKPNYLTATQDNFSAQQLDWLEDLLIRYSGTNTNIFIIEHSLMRNFGPGDRVNGAYADPIMLDEKFPGNMRFKALLTEYKEAILMTGHTHLSFYEMLNFSDENGTAARMIHNSSTCQPRSYTASGSMSYNSEGATTLTEGSEGYIVSVYDDYILYTGYNLTTGKIIPRACYLLSSYSENREDAVSISLKKAPDKTVYTPGEWFDGKGMEIEATFKDGTKKVVLGWGVSNVGKLTPENPVVEIFYGKVKESIKINISFENESKAPFKGEGSLENPYLIENAADFKALTDLFNASETESDMYGKGLYFRQTADIDMSGVEGYAGTPASGGSKLFFGGNYDGGGYTLTVNIKSTGQTSVFPYVYGAIYNMVIRGSIESSESTQPFRTIKQGAVIANCDISLKLTNCICFSNYSTIYNVYVHGTGDNIFSTFSGGKAIKVYSNCKTDSGEALTDSHVTAIDSISDLAKALSCFTTDDDTEGIKALKKSLGDSFDISMLSTISEKDGVLVFSHPEGLTPDDNDDNDDNDGGEQPESGDKLSPFMWGLVQRNYNGKTASILLLKVKDTSAQHIGAPLFEEGLVYTLTIGDKTQKVTPFETVGRLAIGFNLADYPDFDTIKSYKSYDVSLKIENSDGTLLYEDTAENVSSGKTEYLPVMNFEKE
ncbi:MAG: hypothetical protein E7491_02330 [Ruminococcaceae bacterium]|nr:hypothetical protein [Oscillospiraceae bacterium]